MDTRKIVYPLLLVLAYWLCQVSVCAQQTVFRKGDELAAKGDYKNAIKQYEAARLRGQATGNLAMEMGALYKMCDLAVNMGNKDDTIDYLEALLPLTRRAGASYQELLVYVKLQQLFQLSMDMESAMLMSAKADSIASGHQGDFRFRMAVLPILTSEAEHNHNIELAEQYLLEAVEYLKQMDLQERLANTSGVYGNLKNFYLRYRQWEKARQCIDTMVDLYKTFANDPIIVSRGRLDYIRLGSLTQNEVLTNDALQTVHEGFSKSTNTGPADWILYYSMKAEADAALGKYEESCDDLRRVLAIADSSNVLSERHYYNTVHNLANILLRAGHPMEAKESYRRCADQCKEQYGEDSSEYASQLYFLANCLLSCGETREGADYYAQAFHIIKEMFYTSLKYLSAADRNYFWQTCYTPVVGMTEYAWKAGMTHHPFTRESYEAHLLEKNLLLQMERSISDHIYNNQDDSITSAFSKMEELRQRMKRLSRDFAANKEQISDVNRQIHALDRQLTPILSQSGYDRFQRTGYTQIREALKPGDILLDFTDITSSPGKHDYYVYVVRRRQEYPELLQCLNDSLLLELSGTDSPTHIIYQTHVSQRLAERLWTLAGDSVKEGATVYYVPSGILHLMGIENLSLPDGSTLADHYHFVRLTSAREIARLRGKADVREKECPDMVIFGGLSYSMDRSDMEAEALRHDVPPRLRTRGGVVKGAKPWGEMKGSKKETAEVADIMKKAGVTVDVKSGKHGTEEAFLCMDGHAPAFLLLSTHGFYYTTDEAQQYDYLKGYRDGMSLSGLILSGANTAWSGDNVPEGVLSGVLTADKIARMDLHGLELVVLSSCRSGDGAISMDGLYGLQRAFKKAGAQTIIMTLWDVSDNAAKDFTVEFFRQFAKNGWNKQDAFETAKKWVKAKYKDPYYWAAFVMLD